MKNSIVLYYKASVISLFCVVLSCTAWSLTPSLPQCQPLALHIAYQGPAEAATPPPAGKQWYRVANHTHTTYSPDADTTLEQRIRGAAAEGADAIVITDHNVMGACSDPMFVPMDGCTPICGQEYAWWAFDGELGLINLSNATYVGGSTVEEVVANAHNAGGTVVINHPFVGTEPWSYDDLHDGISGIEVWTSLLFVFSGGEQALTWWDSFLARGKMVFGIGGSDLHVNGRYALKPCNYVLATGVTPDGLRDGLEGGHLTISSSATGPRCFIWCDANNDGIYEAPMGANVLASGNAALRFRVEVYDGEGLALQVITKQGGAGDFTVGTGAPWCVDFTASAAMVKDYVRAELRTTDPAYPMGAVANPVYVNYTLGDSDSDGIPDTQEKLYGTDHYSADTDSDGLSDGFEVGYDGDAGAYTPFDPVNNPDGRDLNALSADTDGDGVTDATELWLGTNPLDPSDATSLPLNATLGLGLLLAGLGLIALQRARGHRPRRHDTES